MSKDLVYDFGLRCAFPCVIFGIFLCAILRSHHSTLGIDLVVIMRCSLALVTCALAVLANAAKSSKSSSLADKAAVQVSATLLSTSSRTKVYTQKRAR